MPQSKKVVIIGGGIIGLCSAYYLQKSGHNVTVLEQGNYQEGASHGNAGMLVPSHVVPLAAPGVISQGIRWLFRRDSPFRIKPRLDPSLAAWLWQFRRYCTEAHVEASMPLLRDLSLSSVELFEALSREFSFDFERNGLLMVHSSKKGEKENLKYAKKAQKVGLLVDLLDQKALRALEPTVQPQMTGGAYYRQDAHMNPGAFVREARAFLSTNGVDCKENITVSGFSTEAGRVSEVLTSQGDFTADEVILAAGSWSPQIGKKLGVKLPIQPAKGYSVTLKSPNTPPRIPMILTEAKVTVTPMGNFLRFGGTLELAGFDHSIDRIRASSILNTIPDFVSGVESSYIKTEDVWTGYRPCTPDGLPIIGRSKLVKNLVIATGHAMIGITLGPITGKLVSDLVNNQSPEINLHKLRPERFTNGVADPVPANIVIQQDAVADTH